MNPTPITVAHGDGIGPEIMEATLFLLREAGARLDVGIIEIGQKVYERGETSGIAPTAWDSLRKTHVFLKAPIMTPQGKGFKSLNVTVRKSLGLYANVRPCVSYHPYVKTLHPDMNLVIIRENEEDLYAGIEHRQTDEVMQCLKLITRPGCEKVTRYAFEYALQNGRKRVTCMTKDNIMKLTDGLFHQVFDEIAAEYPAIKTDHMIVDIGAARLADTPEKFDVVLLPNLYGDILSDVAAQVAGSVGLAGSSNIGEHGAMFEAIHGSAPDIAGKDMANPSGLILASVMMLQHIGLGKIASRLHNAWLSTIEAGYQTADIMTNKDKLLGTREFTKEVAFRLGSLPEKMAAVDYPEASTQLKPITYVRQQPAVKELVGVDVFLHSRETDPSTLAGRLQTAETDALKLQMVTNRGVKVWPNGIPETFCTDHWRCRFMASHGNKVATNMDIIALLQRVDEVGLDFIKCENLCHFDEVPGFALGQGQ
ncbi:MAG: NADP-dependent isocitrate dehydrogenase [Chthonomonadales bacterium]